jgi:site-specific DNA-methyltransferase (adenine-specific)
MYLTDPPYNVDYTGGTKDALKIENDNMGDDAYREFLVKAFTCAREAMKAGAVFYIWHADSQGFNVRTACENAQMQVRQCLIWKKNALVMGRQDYQWRHEPCLYGWKEGAAHLWASDRKQTTILEFDRPTKSKEHPTIKPVKLFDYQIQNNTKGQDIVYDGFAGSGTTIVACEQNGRVACCMEYDPKYVDVIVKRWEALTGETAVLL